MNFKHSLKLRLINLLDYPNHILINLLDYPNYILHDLTHF